MFPGYTLPRRESLCQRPKPVPIIWIKIKSFKLNKKQGKKVPDFLC